MRNLKKMSFILCAGVGFSILTISAPVTIAQTAHQHETGSGTPKEFRVVAVRYEGSVLWLPSTFIVKKGHKVKINLINNVPEDPNNHGFTIDEFGVKAVVNRGKAEVVEFTANKEGLFTIYCQLHPAHVGGQLLVIK